MVPRANEVPYSQGGQPPTGVLPVRVDVSGKNIEVTPALRDYARRKIGRIARFFAVPIRAQVTLWVEKGRHGVEVTVPIPANGLLLRAEVEEADMYASIDLAVDKLERQIRKFKTRINRKARRPGGADRRELVISSDGGPAAEEEPEPQVVRVKRFALKPMDVEEAILQMNLLGHDFFVFRNRETAEVNVVYRRHDGQYGLIEPED